MQFIHMADTHLGYRQYGLSERENDFFEVFDQAIDEVVAEHPDFVIHSGDLFEYSRPPTKALLTAQNGMLRLKNEKIPEPKIIFNIKVKRVKLILLISNSIIFR